MAAYVSAVTFSQVSAGGWTPAQRLNIGEIARIDSLLLSAATSTVSQVRIEIGYGASGASAGSARVLMPETTLDLPPVAGAWNISSIAGTAQLCHKQTFTDEPVRIEWGYPVAAPWIYSGTTLLSGGGAFARMRGLNATGSGYDFTLYVKEGDE